ncbi:hypothetical protein JCM10207_008376 [Rhodosporidiobolus poonsookiae]
MLKRHYTAPNITLPPSKTTPAFPGLVSSLRPISRIIQQATDEATLLRRFTYKNKNQFKGTGWWRKLVEVDRTTAKALDELNEWVGEFGSSGDKDEASVISREAVCQGLLRLPRAAAVVKKNVEVLLGCASILERLVHSRAFLAFAVVVVSLVARLHSLFVVLQDELSRTSGVLVRLVELNGLLSTLDKPLRNLPRTARRFLPLDASLKPSLLPVSTGTLSTEAPTPFASSAPSPAPPAVDDLGAVVSRAALSAKLSPSPAPALAQAVDKPKAKKKRPLPPSAPASAAPSPPPPSEPASPASLFPFDLAPASSKPFRPSAASLDAPAAEAKAKKRPRPAAVESEGGERGSVEGVKPGKVRSGKDEGGKKKKVKKRKGGDEIDDIFG